MQVNTIKSKILHVTKNKVNIPLEIYMNGEVLEVVEEYKYLGAFFREKWENQPRNKLQNRSSNKNLLPAQPISDKDERNIPKSQTANF